MAVVIVGNVIASDLALGVNPTDSPASSGTLDIDVSPGQDGSQIISVLAAATDIQALTIPGTCTLTLSQP